MQKQKILAVDDEQNILELIRYNLHEDGYEVVTATTGEEALDILDEQRPDLIMLDIMLPGQDGLQVCKKIKNNKETSNIPIIMLTARGEEIDKVLGLEMGADDYVVKPFGVRELLARVKALLRRASIHPEEEQPQQISVGKLKLDTVTYTATLDGKKLQLTLKEFELLRMLIQNKNRVLTRDHLLDKVWGYEYYGETRTVDVHIRHLRQKLGDHAGMISTVRGLGYMLNEGDEN